MACGPSITFGRAAGDGPRAPQVKEPRQRPWSDTHHAVFHVLTSPEVYGDTQANASMTMLTHYERIERLAASGHSPEDIAGCIKRFEFRCGRGRS